LNIVNGDIGARTYVDLGGEFTVMDKYTLFGRVNNVFDEDPPLITTTYNAHYDVVGRYYTLGARAKF
jgi:outer membrane receptor protein involved in Fe transport